jgi:hypothetical protein
MGEKGRSIIVAFALSNHEPNEGTWYRNASLK